MKTLNEFYRQTRQDADYSDIIKELKKKGIKNTTVKSVVASMPEDMMLVVYTGDSKERTRDYIYVHKQQFGTNIRKMVDYDTDYVETDAKLAPKKVADIISKQIDSLVE